MKRLFVAAVCIVSATPALAGQLISSVPTLDDAGLAALTVVLAVAGAVVVRRNKKK